MERPVVLYRQRCRSGVDLRDGFGPFVFSDLEADLKRGGHICMKWDESLAHLTWCQQTPCQLKK